MKKILFTLSLFILTISFEIASAQESLSLDTIIARVIQTHPSIAKAQESLQIADDMINMAKSGYYPNINASATYNRIGPVTKIDFPGVGLIQLYPNDNYAASVNLQQTIYDFGKTASNIEIGKANQVLAEKGLDISRQNLALAATTSYYTLYFLNQSMLIKDEQLQRLKEHLNNIQTMKATGSATDFDVISTQVQISATESQKENIQASQQIQTAILNSLLGREAENPISLKDDWNLYETDKISGNLNYALEHRNEIEITRQKQQLAYLQLESEKIKNNPSLSAILSGGTKNGYIPNLNAPKLNFVAGLNFTAPLFDGNRRKYNLRMAQSKINIADNEIELESRTISTEIIQAKSAAESARKNIEHYNLQVNQATRALELANVSYKAGTITNLDLLMAETALSESKLMLLKAKVDYQLSMVKLKMASGQNLY